MPIGDDIPTDDRDWLLDSLVVGDGSILCSDSSDLSDRHIDGGE